MNILAIDTSTKDLEIAIKRGEKIFQSVSTQSLQHSKILFSDLETLLEKAEVSKDEIDIISVNLGPGSFTGIRIGVVFAKGMAYALGTKLAACDAFEAVATNAEDKLPAGIICEEKKGGGYFAVAKKVDGKIEISKRGVYSASEIAIIMGEENITTLLSNCETSVGAEVINGVLGLIKIAENAILKGEFRSESELEPVYIKKSQAEEQLEAKLEKESK